MRRGLLFSALLLGSAALLPAPASAGLFDVLFGRSDPAPAARSTPLEFDVRARAPSRPRRVRAQARKDFAARNARVAAIRVDPVADPDWRLKDPTLRRGDIVVLPGGPVVFEGRAGETHEPGDFAPLAGSRVASSVQNQVRQMVAGRWMAAKDLADASTRERRKARRTLAAAR